ncbi:hypothetical protein EOA60_19840 [Mesorhizobium sp. M1A.F.Ca.IN.020.06.1.1]|uniref:hypothetical protein n=1 Tax=unclassified Mesorhizobium TaxID=325217 RepID=UPI000FCB0610|nr:MULTISPECIES: hypothetical protein [unclassified Mesorhizobium]RUW25393.1 hypothetical protein EOA60_19840 [Mesorhizobium sp. M1A.F.Ca.IN.020.06.1.1]RWF78047.1 MAG: hypothetical protein EOQ35_23585 [Mesorhizobium sp.]RWF97379.1 MAG: hypothetical protein EOQ38_24155 [Mesorhizobium sp.]RWG75748.1 MAG: hypothetical protein EOQ68_25405 [Mesorhizobium sp.]RWG97751.1 MAG: hypothetical protein EOQ73_25035 [Mesorhizobium sp.]
MSGFAPAGAGVPLNYSASAPEDHGAIAPAKSKRAKKFSKKRVQKCRLPGGLTVLRAATKFGAEGG